MSNTTIGPELMKSIKDIQSIFTENKDRNEGIEKMKKLREEFKALKLPTVVKGIRLVYEYLESNENLDGLSYWEEEEIDLEGENSVNYFLDLLNNPENKYNKEELLLINESLMNG